MSFGRDLKDFVASFKVGTDMVHQQRQDQRQEDSDAETKHWHDNLIRQTDEKAGQTPAGVIDKAKTAFNAGGIGADTTVSPPGTPLNERNNNPGNVIDNSFTRSLPGYAGTDGKFAKFDTPENGYNAANKNLDSPGYRGLTVAQAIARWAPAGDDNDPVAYAARIKQTTGLNPNDPVPTDLAGRAKFIAGITAFEGGRQWHTPGQIQQALSGGKLNGVNAPAASAIPDPESTTAGTGKTVAAKPATIAPPPPKPYQAAPAGTPGNQAINTPDDPNDPSNQNPAYAAGGGMIRHMADGGPVTPDQPLDITPKPAPLDIAPKPAPQAVPDPASQQFSSPDADHVGQTDHNIAASGQTAPAESVPYMGEALHAGIMRIQQKLGLTGQNGAITDAAHEAGAHALHVNADRPSDEDYHDVRKIIDPSGQMNDTLANTYALTKLYQHYLSVGDPDKAADAASAIINYTRSEAARLGDLAMKAGSPQQAAALVAKAINQLPAGQTVEAVPNAAGGGTFIQKNAVTGEVTGQGAYTPQQLLSMAVGLKNGTAYWNFISQAAKKNDADTTTASERVRKEAADASDAFTKHYAGAHPGVNVDPTIPTANQAAAIPGATPAAPTADTSEDSEDSEDSSDAGPSAAPAGGDPRAANQTASIGGAIPMAMSPSVTNTFGDRSAIPDKQTSAKGSAAKTPDAALPSAFMDTLNDEGRQLFLNAPPATRHTYEVAHNARYKAQQDALKESKEKGDPPALAYKKTQDQQAAAFQTGHPLGNVDGSSSPATYSETLNPEDRKVFAGLSPQYQKYMQDQYTLKRDDETDKEPGKNEVPKQADLDAGWQQHLDVLTPEGGKPPPVPASVAGDVKNAASDITSKNPARSLSQSYQDATDIAGIGASPVYAAKPLPGGKSVQVTVANRQPIIVDLDTFKSLVDTRVKNDAAKNKALADAKTSAKDREDFVKSATGAARNAGNSLINLHNSLNDHIMNAFNSPISKVTPPSNPDEPTQPSAIPVPATPNAPTDPNAAWRYIAKQRGIAYDPAQENPSIPSRVQDNESSFPNDAYMQLRKGK